MKNFFFVLITCIAFSVSAQIDNEHLMVGERAPEIIGKDQFGKEIDSKIILKNNKILLLFYRGNWCGYCKKHLVKVQKNLEALTKKGYYVMVVSPEKPEKVEKTTKEIDAKFSIIHDADNKIMNDFKVAYEVNDLTVPKYLSAVKKRVASHNVENNNVLPVPATYVVDKEGKISFVHYDPDYSKRASLEEILNL